MAKQHNKNKFQKITLVMLMFCIFIFSTTTVFAERIISEKKTNSSYEIVMDGEKSLKPLVTAIEKSAKALHDAAATTHVAKVKVHIRIKNTGRNELKNRIPGMLLNGIELRFDSPSTFINQWAFNSVYLPYTSCNWYNTKTSDLEYNCKDNVYDAEFTFHLQYHMTLSKERAVYNEMKKLVSKFTGSKLEKIHAAYSYITHNIKYSHDNNYKVEQSGILTFKNKKGICTGKAKLFNELCHLIGVDSYEVGGRSLTGQGAHTWSVLKYNGKWYFCDVTNDYYTTLNYFMRGMNWWQENRKDDYAYPLGDTSYYNGYSKILMSKIKIVKEGIPHPNVATSIVPQNTKKPTINTNTSNTSKTSNTSTTKAIVKKEQSMVVSARTVTIKKRLEPTTFIRRTVFTIRNARGVVTFKKTSGSTLLSISRDGNITVNGNGVKGKVYKMKVRVVASGNEYFKEAIKYVVVNVLIE